MSPASVLSVVPLNGYYEQPRRGRGEACDDPSLVAEGGHAVADALLHLGDNGMNGLPKLLKEGTALRAHALQVVVNGRFAMHFGAPTGSSRRGGHRDGAALVTSGAPSWALESGAVCTSGRAPGASPSACETRRAAGSFRATAIGPFRSSPTCSTTRPSSAPSGAWSCWRRAPRRAPRPGAGARRTHLGREHARPGQHLPLHAARCRLRRRPGAALASGLTRSSRSA